MNRRMTKMTSKQAFRGGLAALAGVLLCTVSFSLAAAQQSKLRIVQTNNACQVALATGKESCARVAPH